MSGRRVLVVRLDSLGDVVVCGPAVRAVAAHADRVTFLAGPRGEAVARLLPGVDDVITWTCPWIMADPPPIEREEIDRLVARVRAAHVDEALILTSFHQSALPTALVLRLAGVARITAVSEDFPGRLVDLRLPSPPDEHESQRMLWIAEAAGFTLPPDDDRRPRLATLDCASPFDPGYVVVHPGTDAPARAYPIEAWTEVVARLTETGRRVIVTGTATERVVVARATAGACRPEFVVATAGAFSVAELAAVLRVADVVIAGNTGPAHIAAAVGTPVVSLFAPVVPARRWSPLGAAAIVLGDQQAACRGSRSRTCPIAGHPCLSSVTPAQVVAAVDELAPQRSRVVS
ncbi:MAG: glycosyltransferase family 9 protein [Actinobacteria bacterium]|nr:glycosyltransferase family 9 protein [Actinomycetota bacterium]